MNNIQQLLDERGQQYGSFDLQVKTIMKILNALRDVQHQNDPNPPEIIMESDVENFFLILKLVRNQTANDPDSLDDLCGYARLIREKKYGAA